MPTLRTAAPLGLGLGIVAILLAGCSGGGATPNAAATTPAAAATGAPQPAGTQDPARGGVSGTIAYVSGQLMQVQDTSMQTAVTWTGTTTITKEQAGALTDVVAGKCVVATAIPVGTGGAGGTSTAAPTAQPTVDPNAPVTRVIITDPVSGKCTVGAFTGGGGFTGRTPGQAPSGSADGQGRPSGAPSGFPTGGAGFGGGGARAFGVHNGLVTAVSGDTVTVQTTAQNGTESSSTFTVDSTTTYTTTVTSDASAIVVGQCAAVFGPSDNTGKVTATSITVSAPTNGKCSSFSTNRAGGGFAGRGGNSGTGTRNRGGNGGSGSTSTQGGSNA
jgi:hypothetical protein